MSSETMYFYLEWPPLVLLKRDKGHVESKMMMALIKRCIFPLDDDDDDDGDDDVCVCLSRKITTSHF